MDKQLVFDRLRSPINRDMIKILEGHKYIEGYAVINTANEIFGFDGWGYDVVDIEYRPFEKGGMYTAKVRVTVEGFPPRTDVGVGLTAGAAAKAHDTAVKGAVTEGIKRAMRTFGAPFGNDLYDKLYDQDAAEAVAAAQEAAALTPEQAAARLKAQDQELGQLIRTQGADERRVMAGIEKQHGPWDSLAVAKREELLKKMRAANVAWWAKQKAGAA